MSIIEKAASRIKQLRSAPAPKADLPEAPPAPPAPPPLDAEHAGAPPPPALEAEHAGAPPPPALEAGPAGAPPRHSARRIELDLARMRALGMISTATARSPLLEEFRVIKRPLLKRAFADTPNQRAGQQRPGNLIMVTSSLPGEGKTYCAINLAMSIAMELDHTVLLIDADVANPSVLRTLGLPAQRGMMDILLDDSLDLSDVMLRTNVNNLSILPAGTSTLRATELLASSTMRSLVLEIANRYPDRIIIFDSPPLLPTNEARVLAGHMGQIVMVVEAQKTTQHAVKEALRHLEGCSNVNLVYNKTRDIPGIEETYDFNYG